MAAYNKFNDFVFQLIQGVHNLDAADHVAKIFLTNEAPLASDTVKADMVEITAGNGYTAGGQDVLNTITSGVPADVSGTKVVWTATGAIGPFRYVVLYNDTPAAPVDPLIAWWDHGTAVTLASGDTFTVKFNGSETTGTIFTIS